MAAQIPIKDDAEANAKALDKVRADKQREANDGHDGTWVAHPGLVAVAREVFDAKLVGPNQLSVLREDVKVTAADLLAIPQGTRTDAGLRLNLRVGVQYVEAWLRGQGCVPLYSLMEDAATAEISRAQVWQWLKHGATTDDGQRVDVARVRATLAEELLRVRTEVGGERYDAGRFVDAAALFLTLLEAPTFAPFLTTAAYAALHPEAPFPAHKAHKAHLEATMQTQTQSPTEKIISQATEKSAGEASPVKSEHANRWEGVRRAYSNADVAKLRGSFPVEHTIAKLGAERLWSLLNNRPYVQALGALTGNMAMQQVRAGLEAIYLSGWQVAADANLAGGMYPDQSLYPANSVPEVVRKINQTLLRADQIEHAEGKVTKHWLAPIMADAEAGFGGPLNAFELMKSMIDAGAAGVHFEDQLSSEKKCGHLGGKVLVPTAHFVRTLIAARLAADVSGVPTILVARTDADSAKLLTSDIDERDRKFTTGDRTPEGFFGYKGGIDAAIMRGQAYAPYADLIWCETSTPDLHEAKQFAEGIRSKFPNKMMAYNCSPSFNWKKKLSDADIARFQRELGAMGYKFQFVTLAGFHALNHSMFKLAGEYKERGMSAYSELQQAEFASEAQGYTATKHQREVGTGYFDQVATVISGGAASTLALKESTESKQF
jgi:isocitrate lyase